MLYDILLAYYAFPFMIGFDCLQSGLMSPPCVFIILGAGIRGSEAAGEAAGELWRPRVEAGAQDSTNNTAGLATHPMGISDM